MISTVTTATVAAVNGDTIGFFSLIAVLTLLLLHLQREMIAPRVRGRLSVLARGLQIGLVPLGFAFLVIAGVRLYHLLW